MSSNENLNLKSLTVVETMENNVALIPKVRFSYIDRIRTFLTVSVIIHHCIYLLSVGWWPVFGPPIINSDGLIGLLGLLILPFNQAYFMGAFFFLAGYFVPKSYASKGPGQFILQRAIRLLVPIPFYELLIAPMILQIFSALYNPKPFGQVYREYFANYQFLNNPLWFVAQLFGFDTIFLLCTVIPRVKAYYTSGKINADEPLSNRTTAVILLSITGSLIVLTFIVRIFLPSGVWIGILQPAFDVQYVYGYVLGGIAYKHNILSRLPKSLAIWGLIVGLTLYIINTVLRILFISAYDVLNGGLNALSFANVFLEMAFAVIFFAGLLVLFREKFNRAESKFGKLTNQAAYAVYIIHPLIVISFGIFLSFWNVPHVVWFVLNSIISVIVTWGVAILIKMIPYTDRVL